MSSSKYYSYTEKKVKVFWKKLTGNPKNFLRIFLKNLK